jgi:WD40 repeat protein
MPSLDFTADGKRLASGSWDETIKIWDLSRPAAVQMISGFEPDTIHGVRAVFSDDGKFVAVGCQTNDIKIWDTTTLREIATLPGGGDPLRGGFSRDGKTLLTFTKTSLRLFDIGTQAFLKETRLEKPPRLYSGAALS